MKKHFTTPNLFSLLMLFLFLGINSCKKNNDASSLEKLSDKDFIAESKEYFEQNFNEESYQKELSEKNNPNQFQKLLKKSLWDYAKIKDISIGQSVRIPILFDKEIFTRAGKDYRAMSLYNLSYLMMYKDKKGKIHTEWVVAIPDNDYVDREKNRGVKFSGIINVFDWQGNIIKSYKIKKDGQVFFSKSISFGKKKISVDATPRKTEYEDHYDCEIIDWYSCSGTSADPTAYGCYYTDTEYICDFVPGSGGAGGGDTGNDTGGGGSGPCPGDYSPDDPGCVPITGQGNNTNNGVQVERANNCDQQNIHRDTINDLKDPLAICIFDRLKDNALFQQLLANFQDNKNLNVTFQMGNIPPDPNGFPVAGQTHHDPGTTNFIITIDNTLFGNAGGIAATNTFLHEAFHANLWISAQQWFPNSLPTNFQNMSLIEQIKYLDNRGGNGSAQHNYMATEINNIALALKEYTRVNYPNIYNSNPSYNSYLSMAYNGLDGTSCYTEFVNSLTGNTEQEKIENYSRLKLPLFTDVKCP